MPHSILFVCTANQCRSPLAEVTFCQFLKDKGEKEEDWKIASAGVYAVPNFPATSSARQIAAEMGLDLSSHQAQPITKNLIGSFALVLTMEKLHRLELHQMFPSFANKILMLSETCGLEKDIEDPFGFSLDEYRKTIIVLTKYFRFGWDNIYKFSKYF